MAQDIRSSKSFGAADADRAIAALKFHERVRRKAGDAPVVRDHNKILGNMVDLHHRNMSMVRASLLKYEPTEPRISSTTIDDVEEVEDESQDEEECPAVRTGSQSATSTSDRPDYDASKTGVVSLAAKKAVQAQGVDPAAFIRQMRQGTMSRTASQHLPSSIKGAYAFLQPPEDTELEDVEDLKVDLSKLRGRSFLSRPDDQAGATYDMLAQIRGRKWDADEAPIKGAKSLPAISKVSESFVVAKSSSSVTAGGRSLGALPRVSVDSSPSLSDVDRTLAGHRHGGMGSASGGFLSRLKDMMKR
ncbi:hypothetical protein PLESTB_001478400 [Pleodorina starrii]|uniref:Uncharacterized protein n=1 Tax=Pleodorina starrii TaxID=330485 RepID=A0A9W6BW70_9CHLO|nr:hypothetical protein PLESTM_000649900 [Pleodorina starrii]GLC59364.1 hypothetical protein PLESTB_001478400 [Pleodorina starrii]GLC74437.1 hypothetical protein PLESTF_001512900 [Pleodorina starrii]